MTTITVGTERYTVETPTKQPDGSIEVQVGCESVIIPAETLTALTNAHTWVATHVFCAFVKDTGKVEFYGEGTPKEDMYLGVRIFGVADAAGKWLTQVPCTLMATNHRSFYAVIPIVQARALGYKGHPQY